MTPLFRGGFSIRGKASSGGGASFNFPNKPVGFTTFNTQPWNNKPIRPNPTPEGWLNENNEPSGCDIVTDVTAPVSPSNVLFTDFFGNPRGSGPFNVYYPFANPSEQFNTIYFGIIAKLSSNFDLDLIVGCKFVWMAADQIQGGRTYCGFGVTGVPGDLNFTVNQQGDPDRTMGANVDPDDSAQWFNHRGVYRMLEMKLKLQTSEPASNGELHVWHNGTKTHQYTDVRYMLSGASLTWKSLMINPTYGGDMTGQETPLETHMTMSWDHIIIAGGNT